MKLKHKHSRKAGLPPGTLVHIGEKKSETVTISGVRIRRGTVPRANGVEAG
jgi:hypothetical protein